MTRLGINICNAKKKYINKKILPLEAPCGAQDLDVCDDSGVCDDLIVKTTIVLPLSNATKTNFDITWEKFINKRQHNVNKRKEVQRYDFKSYIRTRYPFFMKGYYVIMVRIIQNFMAKLVTGGFIQKNKNRLII